MKQRRIYDSISEAIREAKRRIKNSKKGHRVYRRLPEKGFVVSRKELYGEYTQVLTDWTGSLL